MKRSKLFELCKRQQYRQLSNSSSHPTLQHFTLPDIKSGTNSGRPHHECQKSGDTDKSNVRCYGCGTMGHMQWNCKHKKSESGASQSKKADVEKPGMKMVSLEKSTASDQTRLLRPEFFQEK